jgi:hypothetical protein
MTSFRPVIATLLVSFLITACGSSGGGGGTSVPPPLPTDLQTTVPTPTSVELQDLNTLRGKLGLGLLIEDSHLITASSNHAQYGLANNTPQAHSVGGDSFWTTEVPGNPHFSGVTANDRCLAAGYAGSCNDVIVPSGLSVLPDSTLLAGINLLAAKPYGGIMLFAQQPRQAGAAFEQGMCMVGCFSWTSLHFGTPTTGGQRQGSGFVLTYPLPDSAVPGISYGHAINLHINAGETLTVDSFTLLDKNGNTIASTLLTQATDPEKFVPGHVAVLVPNSPLVSGMSYTVNFAGKRNGTGFNRTWNFSVS